MFMCNVLSQLSGGFYNYYTNIITYDCKSHHEMNLIVKKYVTVNMQL